MIKIPFETAYTFFVHKTVLLLQNTLITKHTIVYILHTYWTFKLFIIYIKTTKFVSQKTGTVF